MALSEQSKERIGTVFEVAKTIFHWGFIPTVLYLGKIAIIKKVFLNVHSQISIIGFSKGSEPNMPPLSIASLLWQ
jgi:import receptor subunit TOM7